MYCVYNGYKLYAYVCMHMYVHSATRTQGTGSFEGVMVHESSEIIFRMGTVKGVHVCACM